jgi:hypothetical protein
VLFDRDANVGFDLMPAFLKQHANWKAVRIEPTLGIPQWERTADCVTALDAFWSEHA